MDERTLRNHIARFPHKGGVTISVARRLVYMKASRTGGTSLYRGVLLEEIPDVKNVRDDPKGHAEALRELLADPLDFFYFTFVRNPWDRILSVAAHYERDVNEFVEWVASRRRIPREIRDHLTPQVEYSRVGDDVFADFVGRFENMAEDYRTLARVAGLRRERLPRMSVSKRPPRKIAYGRFARDWVAERYAADVEVFGYFF